MRLTTTALLLAAVGTSFAGVALNPSDGAPGFIGQAAAQSIYATDLEICIGSTYDPEVAIPACTRAARSNSLSPVQRAEAFLSRGLTHEFASSYQNAVEDYEEALRLKPGYAAAFAGRGNAFWKMGKQDLAAFDFEVASRLERGERNPFTGRALYNDIRSDLLEADGLQAAKLLVGD